MDKCVILDTCGWKLFCDFLVSFGWAEIEPKVDVISVPGNLVVLACAI